MKLSTRPAEPQPPKVYTLELTEDEIDVIHALAFYVGGEVRMALLNDLQLKLDDERGSFGRRRSYVPQTPDRRPAPSTLYLNKE